MSKIPCAILGATGMVGQRFVQLLEGHPVFEPVVLTASDRRTGTDYGRSVRWLLETPIPEGAKDIPLTRLDLEDIYDSGARLVFSALPAEVAGPLETGLAGKGVWVFSNAAAHRMDPHVPILVPEVNAGHLDIIEGQDTPGKIVTNANCSATGLVMGLAPIRHLGIERVIVTTYQALSGAGHPGVPSLDILGNVVPYIKGEEEKLAAETKRILGSARGCEIKDHPMEVLASCARVSVENGHLEAVVVEFGEVHTVDAITEAFRSFTPSDEVGSLHSAPETPVILTTEPDRPQPKFDVLNGGGMAATVGRLKVDGRRARFYLLSHNTIRGAAGGSILNAELAFDRGLLEVDC